MSKQAVISLSGGMDSSTLLLRLLSEGYQVTALSFDYGQKHKVELERAKELVNYINNVLSSKPWKVRPSGKVDLTKEYGPNQVKHQIIKLDGLSTLLNSNLVEGGEEVPEGHYEEDNMKDTVVPNRNKIFSSIIQAVALSIANEKNTPVRIAMGIHSGDHSIYPDCRAEFRDKDYEAFIEGNWDADRVTYYTPYLSDDKFGILRDGEECCEKLGLDFDEVYKRTMTSYKPIRHEVPEDCYDFDYPVLNGIKTKCYADYKSASSVERVEAFIKLGRPDPSPYADENGPVNWETVKTYVEGVLSQHNK